MSTDVYLGLVEQIDWDALPGTDKWNGNVAHRMGPIFPPAFGRRTPWDALVHQIMAHELDGKQVDWSAFAARLTKPQILTFMDGLYGPDCAEWYAKSARPGFDGFAEFIPYMRELQQFVEGLKDDETYALMAVET